MPGDKATYRAANGRAQDRRKPPLRRSLPASGGPKNPLRKRVALPPAYQEHPVLLRDHDYSRGGGSDEWIGIHSIGIHCTPMQFIPGHGAVPTPVRGKG